MGKSEEISVADLLAQLASRFGKAPAMLIDAATGTRSEMPLFVSHYFPDEVAPCERPEELVIASEQEALLACIRRAQLVSAAETSPLEMLDGSTATVSIYNLPELAACLVLFVEPTDMLLRMRQAQPRYLHTVSRVLTDLDGFVREADEELASVLAPEQEILGVNILDVTTPEVSQALKEGLAEVSHNRGASVEFDAVVSHLESDPLDVTILVRADERSDGVAIELRRAANVIDSVRDGLRTDREFHTLAETLPIGVFVLGQLGTTRFTNRALHDIYGVDALDGYQWLEQIHPDDKDKAEQAIARLRVDRQLNIELRILTKQGQIRWCRIAARDLRDEEGLLNSIVGVVEDVTELRSLHLRLETQASTDALTMLPNRSTLLTHLDNVLDHDKEAGGLTAILFVDLDGFKLVNDTQGHSVGDLLLRAVAGRFAHTLRPGDLMARFGGDEFVVVATSLTSVDDALAVAERLHAVLKAPLLVQEQSLSTTASIGISVAHDGAAEADDLLGDADLAMYEAKRLGRGRTAVYNQPLRDQASQRFDISIDLRNARPRRELRAAHQPIFDLTSGKPVGCEVLLRWDHPAHGLLMPGSFIQLAEESGLIADLGDWVVTQAASDLARLRYNGLVDSDFFVTINISTLQLSQLSSLAHTALDAVGTYGLRTRDLVFELTESVPVDSIPEAAERIRQLKGLGFRLAIDDFGTGYSSLEYLTVLPFDILKLDPTFTARLMNTETGDAVVESIALLAERLDFSIVAEGIETGQQLETVRSLGIELGQGYYYCRPQPISELMALFTELTQRQPVPGESVTRHL